MKANFSQQNTKRIVAGMLAVWLSGVMFLFCCEATKSKVSGTESCPLAQSHLCHKQQKSENASQLASFQTEYQTANCCRFPSQVFDKARKLETNHQPAEVTTIVKIPAPKLFPVKREFSRPKIYRSLVLNRGSTRLVNCVFRI